MNVFTPDQFVLCLCCFVCGQYFQRWIMTKQLEYYLAGKKWPLENNHEDRV